MPSVRRPCEEGDMLRSEYDPDLDGKIALPQLVDAVCSETEAGTMADEKKKKAMALSMALGVEVG